MKSDLVLNKKAHNWSDSILIKAHDKCELTLRNLILEVVRNNWQWLLSHCGVWVLSPLFTLGLSSRNVRIEIAIISSVFPRDCRHSPHSSYCVRFYVFAAMPTKLLSFWTQNIPAYGGNLLPPTPNPDDRASMLTRNDGKILTIIWRHILRHCNLQAVFCPRFVLSLSVVCTGHDR
jgi:hypothetical protein